MTNVFIVVGYAKYHKFLPTRQIRLYISILIVIIGVVLGGCAPQAGGPYEASAPVPLSLLTTQETSSLQADTTIEPKATSVLRVVLHPESAITTFDPPGTGSAMTLRLRLGLHNVGTMSQQLTRVPFTLHIAGIEAYAASLTVDKLLRAQEELVLEETIRLDLTPHPRLASILLQEFNDPTMRASVVLHLSEDGRREDVGLGGKSPYSISDIGTIKSNLTALPPQLEVLTARITPDGAQLEMMLQAENPGPVGYALSSPRLSLVLDQQLVSQQYLASFPMNANGITQIPLQFPIDDMPALAKTLIEALPESLGDVSVEGSSVILRGGLHYDILGMSTPDATPLTLNASAVIHTLYDALSAYAP